jgi:hypothetical protein
MDALVVKLLAKNPADRYASATELLDDLERVRDGLAPVLKLDATTQPLGKAQRAALRMVAVARRRRATRTLAVASVAVLALLGTFLFGLLQDGRGAVPRAQGVARNFIDPPAKAAINTTKTGARTPSVTGSVPDVPSVASATASPTAPAVEPLAGSPDTSTERTPVVPAGPPPEEQTPAESQYGGGN